MRLRCRGLTELFLSLLSGFAAAGTTDVSGILDSLASVHPIGKVAISPNGKRVVYGNVLTGKRRGADVDVSALWVANAKDGSGANRLTACPGAVCDEHGAAWSTDGTHISFITTDEKDQPQV